MSSISVIVPVYRSPESLHELYERLNKTLSALVADWEILLIEDCGGDNSWEIVKELCAKDRRVRGVRFARNFGQHYGITAGMDLCTKDWAVVMDCDLQDRPEEIAKLYHKAQEGFDIVLAARQRRHQSLLQRFIVATFYRVFNFLTDGKYDARIGNFRIVSRKVIDNFKTFREQLRFFGALVQWMGFPAATVEVQHDPRPYGESSYNYYRLLALGFNTVIAYSDKPLRLCIGFGLVTMAFSFSMAAFILYRYLAFGSAVMGWSSLIVTICFFSGVIILILGLIGIYLGKVFEETKRRPLYIIDQRING